MTASSDDSRTDGGVDDVESSSLLGEDLRRAHGEFRQQIETLG